MSIYLADTPAKQNKIWRQNAAKNRVVLVEGTKVCRLCNIEKCVTEFPVHRQMIGGRAHECRVCTRARQRAWRNIAIERPAFVAARLLSQTKMRAKRYGLTLAELQEIETRANGLCDICKCPPKSRGKGRADKALHTDHCHKTGRVRGMLCGDCNRAIGIFRDDPAMLRRAAAYLERE